MGEGDPLRDVLRDIRDELDEHLAAINENTGEVANVHEEVAELEVRLMKLAERVDALQALVLAQTRERMDTRPITPAAEPRSRPVRLTANEESVVRVLVAAEGGLPAREIGKRAGLTQELAVQVLSRLVHKGVPLVVRAESGATVYSLDGGFRITNQETNFEQ